MNSKEKLMKVKQYIEKLNFKLSNEETLSPNDEKIINYIEFIMKINKKEKDKNFTNELQKYRSNR